MVIAQCRRICNILMITEQHIMLKKLLYINKYRPQMEELDRTSEKNREFVCACGKAYLSYAALFTHIKQKHNGQAPGPIIRPRSQRKRGRPKKSIKTQNQVVEEGKIVSGGLLGASNTNLFDKQFEFIQQVSIKPLEQKTKQSSIFTKQTSFKDIITFRSSAFSFYNSQPIDNTLHRHKSQILQKKYRDSLDDSDHNSEKIFTPKTSPTQTHELHYNNIIQRLKQLCQHLTQSQAQKLKIASDVSKSFLDRSPLIDDCSILSKIQIFKEFLQQRIQYQEICLQIFIVFDILVENVFQENQVQSILLGEELETFMNYLNGFILRLPEIAKEKGLQQLEICKNDYGFKVFLEFFNWLSIQSFNLPEKESRHQQFVTN